MGIPLLSLARDVNAQTPGGREGKGTSTYRPRPRPSELIRSRPSFPKAPPLPFHGPPSLGPLLALHEVASGQRP